jgi:hypothetical protein
MTGSPGEFEPTRPRRSLLRGSAIVAVLVVSCALAVAACGGGSPDPDSSATTGAAQSSSGVSSSFLKQSVAFAQCMRSHGVTNYPDPSATGGAKSITKSGINTNSPTYQAASQSCQKYAPSGGAVQGPSSQANTQQLKFAQCMRKHGVTKFPDPSANSSGGPQSVTQYGVNPNSPTFQAANSACQSLLSGGSGS